MKFSISGLNHLGLVVSDIAVAKKWFLETLGCRLVEDRGELVFFMIGDDIMAIKTPAMAVAKPEHGGEASGLNRSTGWQSLDHYGFYAATADEVDHFAEYLREHQVEILKGPYDRSDGRSVYFRDPCGMVGEYLFLRSRHQD